MAEVPATTTVNLEPSPELLALVDRLAGLVEKFAGCTIHLLNPQPGDVIVLEYPHKLSERGYARIKQQAADAWPDHKAIILEDGARVAGVRGKQSAIIHAAVNLFRGEYGDLRGPIILPHFSDEQQAKLHRLSEALKDAGYEWEELT